MTNRREPDPTPLTDCPACQSEATAVFSLDAFTIADCAACGHRFADGPIAPDHVEDVYGDGYFFEGKDGYDDYLADADLLRVQGRRYGQLLNRHAAPGTVLDVGAAAGFLQAGYEDEGWDSTGLEPNAAMSAYARDTVGVKSRVGTLEDAGELPVFDAVSLIQVVGHFHDLANAMGRAAALTKVGGLLLVEYWRRDAWIARLLGRRWHEYSPPSVLHFYSRASIDRLMATHRFDCIASGAPKKYISGHHARSLLSHKLSQMPLGGALAKATKLIPENARFRYPAFDLEWRLYRRLDDPKPNGDRK